MTDAEHRRSASVSDATTDAEHRLTPPDRRGALPLPVGERCSASVVASLTGAEVARPRLTGANKVQQGRKAQ